MAAGLIDGLSRAHFKSDLDVTSDQGESISQVGRVQDRHRYPDEWIDYSTFDIARGDAFGNMRRAEAFLCLRNLAKLKQPVDPIEWPIDPQIPGAVIMFSPNAEFSRPPFCSCPILIARETPLPTTDRPAPAWPTR